MYNLITMSYILFLFLILYLGTLPAIGIGYFYEKKKGVPKKAIASFVGPDGQRRQTEVDVTWSWTIFIFGTWSLAFRGQFLDFLIMMITSAITLGAGAFTIAIFAILYPKESLDQMGSVSKYFSEMNTWAIIFWVLSILIYLGVSNYYVAFGNKRRIKQLMNRGFDFSITPKYGELLSYVGIAPRIKKEDLPKNVKAGETHDYVVPDKDKKENVGKPVDEKEIARADYARLTMQDLKLLLRSEGIPFPSTTTKEQLLELVEEHIISKI